MDLPRVSFPSLKEVPPEAWQKLAQKRIYFGHQSVGNNIIEGIEAVKRENPQIQLGIIKTYSLAEIRPGIMGHSSIGKNTQPATKIDDFRRLIDKNGAGNVDIAFFKLCYVDIGPNTDVEKLFDLYKKTMAALSKSNPGIAFVHVTSPWTSVQSGWKAFVKRIIGRPVDGYEDNMKRHAFNELMRSEYSGKQAIFDLAMIESTFPDGKGNLFTKDGKSYPYLIPEYTNDGGHLNEMGRRIVAEQLLIFLATLSS